MDGAITKAITHAVADALAPRLGRGAAGRRRALRLLGGGTLLGALHAVLPFDRAHAAAKEETEAAARGLAKDSTGKPLEKTALKVGFVPITCATPIIMAHPMGYYKKYGLDVEVVKTAGWAVARDKSLNREYDASHMLTPMPLAITPGRRVEPGALHHAGGREPERPGHHPVPGPQGQARSQTVEGDEVRGALRVFDAQLPAALLRGRTRPGSRQGHPDSPAATARDGGQPARRQRRWLPGARPVQPARGVREGGLHPSAVEGDLGRPPVLRLRRQQGLRRQDAQHLRGAVPRRGRRHPLRRRQVATARRSPPRSRRPTT